MKEHVMDSHLVSGFQRAIDVLRQCAEEQRTGGYKAHHNALIYAANVLENTRLKNPEVDHDA